MRTPAEHRRDAALVRLRRLNRWATATALVGAGVLVEVVAAKPLGHSTTARASVVTSESGVTRTKLVTPTASTHGSTDAQLRRGTPPSAATGDQSGSSNPTASSSPTQSSAPTPSGTPPVSSTPPAPVVSTPVVVSGAS